MIFPYFQTANVRKDDITSDDIYAVVEAGALAGVLRKQEHELIETSLSWNPVPFRLQ